MCILLFSSIACAGDSGSEGAQDTGLIVVCVFCCFPVLPVPVTQVQKALWTQGLIVVCVFCCFPVLPVPVTQVQKALRTRVS